MIKAPENRIKMNVPQAIFYACKQLVILLIWGRGTGKSTTLGIRIHDCVLQMPRSSGALVGQSFRQIEGRTLPSTIAGLEQCGFILGVHYTVGKRPPKSWKWPEPYEPPLDAKHAMFWYNGTVVHFISLQEGSASGRGLNIDWVIGDEAATFDETKFMTDVVATNRANLNRIAHYPDGSWAYYKDCSLHHSMLLATSMPVTVAGRWVFAYEKQAAINPDKVAVILASAIYNLKNLGADYFDKAKAIMPLMLYNAEVLNIRLKAIDDGFYPLLNEDLHTYNYNEFDYLDTTSATKTCADDTDWDKDEPLVLSVDWGAHINCMLVHQCNAVEHRTIKEFFVKHPRIIDHLVDEEFAPYYAPHVNRVIYLYFDPSGNAKVANSRLTYVQQLKVKLEKHGWTVQLMTGNSRNFLHEDKYNLWNAFLKNADGAYPTFKINRGNCPALWVSMTNAPAKQGLHEAIKKDKSSERKKNLPQEHATHFSDSMDVVIVDLYGDRMFITHQHIPVAIR